MNGEKISAVIIVKNEEKILAQCLDSLAWVDEIIVIDSGSTDRTVKIAKAYGAKVSVRKWEGFAKQKNFSISKVNNPWILSVDADEIVTSGLKEEILKITGSGSPFAKVSPDKPAGYNIPRRTYFYGRLLKFGNIYPDYQLRLFKKGSGKYEETEIHERFILEGRVENLINPMIHYSKDSVKAHIESMNSYTSLEVKRAVKKGYKPTGYSVLIKPVLYFAKHYIFRGGFLDGFAGLVYYSINSMYIFTTEIKIMEAVGIKNISLLKTIFKKAR